MTTKAEAKRASARAQFKAAVDDFQDALARQPEDAQTLSPNSEYALFRLWWGFSIRGRTEAGNLLIDLLRSSAPPSA